MSGTLVIPEAGHNWCNDMGLAKELIQEAKYCGASVIKFQLYDTRKIKKPTDTNYFELLKAELSRKDMLDLANECYRVGIKFAASAFDVERVEWLEEIDTPFHKIAARCIYDKELYEAMKKTGRKIIGSTLEYSPDIPKDINLLFCRTRRQILRDGFSDMPDVFGFNYVGFSDHSVGMEKAYQALGHGAKIIEKHFTLDKNLPGWDQPGSMTSKELKELMLIAEG